MYKYKYLDFSGYQDVIPFVKPAPIEEEQKKQSKKKQKGQGDKKEE